MHIIHGLHLRLVDHLFRLQVRAQTAVEALDLSQEAPIALPYHKVALFLSLSLQPSFLLRSHKFAFGTTVFGSSVPQPSLLPLLRYGVKILSIFHILVRENVIFEGGRCAAARGFAGQGWREEVCLLLAGARGRCTGI